MDRQNWIVAIGGTETDGIELNVVNGSKDKIKRYILDLINECYDRNDPEDGTFADLPDDVTERSNGHLYAWADTEIGHYDIEAAIYRDIHIKVL